MKYYDIRMDGQSIYNPQYKEMTLLAPSVTMGAGEAGNFDFVFPRNHIYIDSLVPYGSTIEVFEDGKSIFYGRPLPPSTDIFRQKKVHCEGALAFLNDVICPPNAPGLATSMNDGQYYRFLINYYNSQQIRTDRKLFIGSVPYGGVSRVRDWSYRSCMDEMRNNVLPYTGGIIIVRRQNGNTYIDWVNEFTSIGNQPIMIGLNLLDVNRTEQPFYTMAIASGGVDTEGKTVTMNAPVKLTASVCGKYGNICAYLSYPDVTDVSVLQARCNSFLAKQQFNGFSFNADAVDMHIQNSAYEQLVIGKKANIKFSDLDEVLTMPITRVVVDISNGKKTVSVSSDDWTEKKQYIKNETQIKSLTEMQADSINTEIEFENIDEPNISIDDLAYDIDPITGNKIFEETTIDPETGEVTKTFTIVPDDIILRKVEGEYGVGYTITGDLIRISPTGEQEEISEYTILPTDRVTVWHSNGVIDEYGVGQNFTLYYGDNIVIETADGYTITYRTYEEDGAYDVGDVIDQDDFDLFFEYGDGTEVKADDDSWEIDVDGIEITGTESDPQAVTATVAKTPDSSKITSVKINGDEISSSVSEGSTDLNTPLTASISTGVDGQGIYATDLLITPSEAEYNTGDAFVLSDFTVELLYNDGNREDVTNQCTYNIEDGYVFVKNDSHSNLVAVYNTGEKDLVATAKLTVTHHGTSYKPNNNYEYSGYKLPDDTMITTGIRSESMPIYGDSESLFLSSPVYTMYLTHNRASGFYTILNSHPFYPGADGASVWSICDWALVTPSSSDPDQGHIMYHWVSPDSGKEGTGEAYCSKWYERNGKAIALVKSDSGADINDYGDGGRYTIYYAHTDASVISDLKRACWELIHGAGLIDEN